MTLKCTACCHIMIADIKIAVDRPVCVLCAQIRQDMVQALIDVALEESVNSIIKEKAA